MKKKYRIMLDVFIIIVSLGFIVGIIDYNRVKENKNPVFLYRAKRWVFWKSNLYWFRLQSDSLYWCFY